ncbi:MAG: glucosylglycerol hydrolase, partial [Halobaculum sp.]
LVSTLHTLPEPKRVVFDIALGHAEGRATELLPEQYFSGPGMYGMELDYTQPVVRATLLEMQRRKLNFGADGVRVDGAQDFT